MPFDRDAIARRAAREIAKGSIVNLGIGLPTLVADHIAPDSDVWLHTENGLLGMGPFPFEGEENAQIINAGKQTVTVVPGGSCFDSAISFGMIRGGHVDLTILGAMQVRQAGDLANWSVPGGKTMGIGGAMDLAAGARRILVLTTHVTKAASRSSSSVARTRSPRRGVVDRVITDLAVLDVVGDGFRVVERGPDVTMAEIREKTGAPVLD